MYMHVEQQEESLTDTVEIYNSDVPIKLCHFNPLTLYSPWTTAYY